MRSSFSSLIVFFKLFLPEAQVVCTGQPVLTAGDPNVDPAVIPFLAKGISAGKFC